MHDHLFGEALMQGWGGPPGHGGPPPPPGGFGQPPQPPQQGYGHQPHGYGHAPQHGYGPQPGAPMQQQHPYAPPGAYGYGPPQPYAIPNPYALTCPRCQSGLVHKPTFTFWGGIVGPALLSHAVCNSCHFGFNWKTGKSNTTAIIIYYAVIFGIVIVVGIIGAASQ